MPDVSWAEDDGGWTAGGEDCLVFWASSLGPAVEAGVAGISSMSNVPSSSSSSACFATSAEALEEAAAIALWPSSATPFDFIGS